MDNKDANNKVVVSCADWSTGAAADGLRCRFGQGGCADAYYDEERRLLCCSVDKEDYCIPSFEYEVVDARGKVLFQSTACRKDPGTDCCRLVDGQDCCPPGDGTKDCCKGAALAVDGGAATASGARPVSGSSSSAARAVLSGLSWLDRLLPVWIVAAMVLGVLLGSFVPQVRSGLAVLHIGGVSLPIALGLWLMMWPVLTKVRYELLATLLRSRAVAKQFAVSFALNWLVGPALMTALAWACLPDLPGFRNGVIMVGLARCIAMVLIWNELAQGDPELCAVMVAFNSVLQIILYAPLSLLYLQVASGGRDAHVGFWPVARSVLLFLGVPLVAGILLRVAILATKGRIWFERRFMPWFGPCALLGLLYTIVVMFAAQDILSQAGNVARVAVPMLIYFLVMFAVSLGASYALHVGYPFAVTQAFTAASNNFELAIAVAVGTFGVQSQEALAATVGPLIEVPVLLGLVYVALWLKRRVWDRAGFAAGGGAGVCAVAALGPVPARHHGGAAADGCAGTAGGAGAEVGGKDPAARQRGGKDAVQG